MSVSSKRLAVFSIREHKGGSVWVRAGSAFVNKDGSFNVHLDVLPLDGKLHVREAMERKDQPGSDPGRFAAAPTPDSYAATAAADSVGGH
jgi:hypothetical protein